MQERETGMCRRTLSGDHLSKGQLSLYSTRHTIVITLVGCPRLEAIVFGVLNMIKLGISGLVLV